MVHKNHHYFDVPMRPLVLTLVLTDVVHQLHDIFKTHYFYFF